MPASIRPEKATPCRMPSPRDRHARRLLLPECRSWRLVRDTPFSRGADRLWSQPQGAPCLVPGLVNGIGVEHGAVSDLIVLSTPPAVGSQLHAPRCRSAETRHR